MDDNSVIHWNQALTAFSDNFLSHTLLPHSLSLSLTAPFSSLSLSLSLILSQAYNYILIVITLCFVRE